MSDAVLDTGALIAFERNERRVVAIVARALEHHDQLLVPAGAVAQPWRDGTRQARAAGQLCGLADIADVVDASVAVVARERGARALTSDPDDLRRLDRRLEVITI